MSAPFNNTTDSSVPQTSQPLGAPLSGSTHTGSTNNPFTDNNQSTTANPVHGSANPVQGSHGQHSHPSAALSGQHNTGIGGANTDQGNYGAAAPGGAHSSANPLSSHDNSHSSHAQSGHQGQQKEGLMDALNPKTSGGTHLPHKAGEQDSHSHSSNTHGSSATGTANATGNDAAQFGNRSHGQQTGNTIYGASNTGANKTGFTESAHSSNINTHSNVDANPSVHDHDRTAQTSRVTGQEAGGLAPRGAGPDDGHDPKLHATPGLGKDLATGGDSYHDQPGSAHASSHRNKVDPSDVNTELGSGGLPSTTRESGGGPTSVGGGMGTGDNRTIPGGVQGTGGMGKRDGEDAMGGGGGVIGKLASKLGMGHGNTKTTEGEGVHGEDRELAGRSARH